MDSDEPDAPELGPLTRAFDRSIRALAMVGGLGLLWLMGLVVYSVTMRYLFNAPPFGVYDTAEVTLLPIVFIGIVYCGWTNGHVAVDLIRVVGSPQITRWSDFLMRLLGIAIMSVLTWQSAKLIQSSYEFEEATNTIEILHYPFVIIMTVCCALFTIILVIQAVRALRNLPEIKN